MQPHRISNFSSILTYDNSLALGKVKYGDWTLFKCAWKCSHLNWLFLEIVLSTFCSLNIYFSAFTFYMHQLQAKHDIDWPFDPYTPYHPQAPPVEFFYVAEYSSHFKIVVACFLQHNFSAEIFLFNLAPWKQILLFGCMLTLVFGLLTLRA